MASNSVDDDLDFNPFYKVLQNKFKVLFEQAQAKGCMICVPLSSSIQGIHFDRNFVEMHIVKPSPYFKGIYVTTDKHNTGSLSIEQNIIETGQGFPDSACVHILAEELGYNKECKSYRILLIDRPLTGVVAVNTQKDPLCDHPAMYELKTSLSQCQAFIDSIPECQQVVQTDVEHAIRSFETNYMLLRGFLKDAAEKIRKMHLDMSERVLLSLPENLSSDQRIIENVYRSVESVILSRLHGRLFPVICEDCQQDNSQLEVKVQQLRKTSHAKLEIDKRFQCSQYEAMAELGRLGSLKTALEKLTCIKSTLDKITKTLEAHLTEKLGRQHSDVPLVASDDLISLLVSVIIQCRNLRLQSEIFFIEYFHWTSSSVDNISYCFVTLKAAVQFILSLDVGQEETSVSSRNPQMDWQEMSPDHIECDNDGQLHPRLIDHSLHVMAKRVELSTREFVEANKMSAPPGRPVGRQSNEKSKQQGQYLGDFLSSLQDDVCCSSYGKQT